MGFLLAGTPFTPKKALSAGLINEVTDADNLINAAKKYIVDGGKSVQPWDEKGFRFPGGLPYTPKRRNDLGCGIIFIEKKFL